MFNKLMLVGLGFMLGWTLVEILTDMATGMKPVPSDVSWWLVTAGLLVVGLLVTHWWKRKR